MASKLCLFLSGTFKVTLNDQPLTRFEYDKVRALLAYLAVESGFPHRRDVLTGLFWPEQSDIVARKSLNQALYILRKVLGNKKGVDVPFILADRTAVQLNPAANVWVDVREFEKGAAAVSIPTKNEEPDTTYLTQLKQTAALYQGDFLKGLTISDSPAFDDWLALTREWLHRLAANLFAELTDIHLLNGEPASVLKYAQRQTELEPWHEEAHRQLMLILARMGNYNRALAQYDTCREVLAAELGLEPMPETVLLYERICTVRERPLHHNLPADTTKFVGRENEYEQLKSLLALPQRRLITLVGLGGIGKTRLALAAARKQVNAFLEGACFVPLAALESTGQLATTIAAALDITLQNQKTPEAALLNTLSQRELLLVLDNFEHLMANDKNGAATSLLAQILTRAAGVKILVTSREVLKLPGEWVINLGGLAYPQKAAAVDPTTYSALRLFAQSVRRIQPHYELAGAETAVVSHICRLVDGSPLALELAAAWANMLSSKEIAAEIQRSLDFLATDAPHVPLRQRSIRAVFDATWRRLSAQEQALFAQLSIFRGGFTRTAVQEITNGTLQTLAGLVNKACLQYIPEENRYHLHELLRQYSAEKLGQKQLAIGQRMSEFFQEFALTHQNNYGRLSPEWPNIMAGMRLAYQQANWPLVVAYANTLIPSWKARARYADMRLGLVWAKEAAEQLGEEETLALILLHLGEACIEQSDYNTALHLLGNSLERYKKIGGDVGVADVKYHLARIAIERTDFDEAKKLLQESQSIRERLNDKSGVAATLLRQARIWYKRESFAEAVRLGHEAIACYEVTDDENGQIESLRFLAFVAIRQQNYLLAQTYCDRAIKLTEMRQDKSQLGSMFYTLTVIHRWLRNFALAKEYGAKSLKLLQQTGRKRTEGMVLRELGFIHKETADYHYALQLCRQSLNIFRDLQDDLGCVYSLRDIGDILANLGRPTQAQRAWAEAEEIASTLDNKPLLTAMRQRLGKIV